MEKLLDMAVRICDDVEVYQLTDINDTVNYKKAGLDTVNSKSLSGVCLRIIKNGRLGYAYTRNLIDRKELLDNALASMEGGVRADFSFPYTSDVPELKEIDRSFKNLSSANLVDECRRVNDHLQTACNGDITLVSHSIITAIRIINCSGTDLSYKFGQHWMMAMLSMPGSLLGILRLQRRRKLSPYSSDLIEEILSLYDNTHQVAKFKAGRMKTLFTPNSMSAITWRIKSGTNAQNIHEDISPLVGRIGEKIFDEKVTIIDNPLDDRFAGARPFDDEGVVCRSKTLFEKGVLKNIYCNLDLGQKLGQTSTGNGFKTVPLFKFNDPLTLKPIPSPEGMKIMPGKSTFSELVKSIDRGIIVDNIQGGHSGNIPNGDFSIGVPSGFYVENGEIIGRIKDTMVAGNIYDIMKRVVDLGSTLHPCWESWTPAILFDDVNVSAKQ